MHSTFTVPHTDQDGELPGALIISGSGPTDAIRDMRASAVSQARAGLQEQT